MEAFDAVMNGFAVALTVQNLGFVFVGAVLGTIVGMLPGIGPAAGIALLLPMTFGLTPVSALIMLAGIYYGSQYGNTVSAILLNTPGTGSSVMTTVDGYPMAQAGRGGPALAVAAVSSFVAGTVGAVLLTLLSLPLAAFAIRFGPPEYFMLMLFALTAVGALVGSSPAKAAVAVFIGLMITTVGVDLQTGLARFTFDVPELYDGVPFVLIVVGFFAVGQSLGNVSRLFQGKLKPIAIQGSLWCTRDEWKRSVKPIARGGLIGFLVGALPGAGATIATILAYSTEKKLSRTPEKFGTGIVEGVAAPESANNASTCGAFVPLLTLGIPGSGTTAVLLGAFIMYGIQPGPLLFRNNPDIVWGLINSMYIGNVMLLVLNLPLVPLFARLLYMPPGLLLSIIMVIASVGVYALNGSTVDLFMLLVVGVFGYLFRLFSIPIAPLILAVVLGEMLEQRFRQALSVSDGNPMIFLHSGICMFLAGLTIFVVFFPILKKVLASRRGVRLAPNR